MDVFGFPGAKITVDSEFHVQDIKFRSETVRVVEVFPVLQHHGFTAFPGFQVDGELEHGFSGGPVFYKGVLCGIFSGPDYIASLWPLLLHEYPRREDNSDVDLLNAGSIQKPLVMSRFADLFDSGTIRTEDYDEVRGRAKRVSCEEALAGSKIEKRCTNRHAVLAK